MGLFVAIEGGDGSGKRTHAGLLKDFLESTGKDVFEISFPRYGKASARYAGRYLDGQYGQIGDIHPDLSSMIYAIDRFAATEEIEAALNKPNSVVIADRYIASNLAHQGANPRLQSDDDRHKFYNEIKELEFTLLGITRPNLNIVLVMPTNIAQENVDKKGQDANRTYTDKKRDILEADANHLERAKANFEELCQLYPEEFVEVKCTNPDGNLRSIDDIQAEIRQHVTSHL